jgi:hypothetical protein
MKPLGRRDSGLQEKRDQVDWQALERETKRDNTIHDEA